MYDIFLKLNGYFYLEYYRTKTDNASTFVIVYFKITMSRRMTEFSREPYIFVFAVMQRLYMITKNAHRTSC